jgi:hypothetical protein
LDRPLLSGYSARSGRVGGTAEDILSKLAPLARYFGDSKPEGAPPSSMNALDLQNE